jgi:hypothetical protein
VSPAGAAKGPLPTFVIIGAQKSATRWLRVNLGEHPEIFTSDTEVSYFNDPKRVRALQLRWYRAQFEACEGQPHLGEATPGYMMWRHNPPEVAARMRKAIPHAKLFAVLRDPVERAASAVRHHIKHERLPPGTDLRTAVERTEPERDRLGIISGGWYATSLAPFRERYGKKLAVLLYDDVRDDPRRVYRAALEHLGVDDLDFVPEELAEVRYGNADAAQAPAGAPARAEGGAGIDAELRRELFDRWFRTDVDRLQEDLGRDLSAWYPDRDGG